VPRREVAALLGSAQALVNNMRPGATDKVVYEAAATCLPVLASNPALDGFLPESLRFPRDDHEALAQHIRGLSSLDLASLGRELRARVERDHSVEGWAERVVEVASR
jgi:glycosyltransferase involved in cell wall biosynthesis